MPSRPIRAAKAVGMTLLLLLLVWVGWNTGPARHLGMPRMDVLALLGYGLLTMAWRLTTTSVRHRR